MRHDQIPITGRTNKTEIPNPGRGMPGLALICGSGWERLPHPARGYIDDRLLCTMACMYNMVISH